MRLPPLTALRVFEVAGRRQNFSLAAEELGVTPGAVSRQIKALESHLGVALFDRKREMGLTETGRRYFRVISSIFNEIHIATNELFENNNDGPLKIVTSTMIAMRWIFPLLPDFSNRFPELTIAINTNLPPIETQFENDSADIVIRLGKKKWAPSIAAHQLFKSEYIVVCSPKLKHLSELKTPEDLTKFTLLYSALRPDAWTAWMKATGVNLDVSRSVKLDNMAMTFSAAIEGMGVAISESYLVREALQNGTLVKALDFCYSDGSAFYLLYQKKKVGRHGIKQFRDWLLEKSKK
jgi:LysR family glycine cleavage system transcriptional activator